MNTIHIILDTLKRSYVGCYGSTWCRTPNLDRLARRSVRFSNAYAASFPCMPARRDFMTGNCEFPTRGWGPLEETDVTVAAQLGRRGVVTGLVTDHYHLFREGAGNYHFDFSSWDFIRGIEGDRVYSDPEEALRIDYHSDPNRIQKKYRDYYFKYKHFRMKTEDDWFAARTFRSAADWVRRNRSHRNGFHLMIDCFPPHEPFDPPPGYAEQYDPDYAGDRLVTPEYEPAECHYTPREQQHIRALYAGNVTFADACFGAFMEAIEPLNILDDTMIVVSTDHGTYTTEHGWTGKLGTYLYDCVTHVPLLIYHPGVDPRVEDAVVSNIDIAPTLLDARGIEPEQPVHGASLLPLLGGRAEKIRDAAHTGFYGRQHIVNDGRYAFHLAHDQSQPLYWHGLTQSYFAGAGPARDIEVTPEGVRRRVELFPGVRDFYLEPALFDLRDDPGQNVNVYAERPDLVRRFEDEIRRFCAETHAPPWYLDRLAL
ncbi:MAG: sulfatase [Phycisphaerae bacterium]|nr:sulfatase [Phycisphaerae bacterium]